MWKTIFCNKRIYLTKIKSSIFEGFFIMVILTTCFPQDNEPTLTLLVRKLNFRLLKQNDFFNWSLK